MLTRDQATQIREQLCSKIEAVGVNVDWLIETGSVVIKRNGKAKLSWSVRSNMEDARKAKDVIQSCFPDNKITLTNMLGTYRSEVKLTMMV